MVDYKTIGKSHKKVDCFEKLIGSAKYSDDLKFENMAYISILRSPIPHGDITKLDYSEAIEMDGIIDIFTEKDVPGPNGTGIILKDEPVLTSGRVKRVGDPIALIVAETKELAEKAKDKIQVEFKELPANFTTEESMDKGAIQIHEERPNVLERKITRGNAEKALEESDIIVENTYKTGRVEHSYIEPEAGVAKMENGVVTIWATSQNVHFDRGEVARNLNLSVNKVRVILATTGGGFGGKLDVSAQVYLGLAAMKTGRPVKYTYTREESIQVSGKRHPYTIHIKTGADKDGKIKAMKADFVIDTGAYASYGPGVLTRGAVHLSGPYEIPNVDILGKLVFTNNPFCGAMRGFGVPQVAFAHELQMDQLAEKAGLSPYKVRMINAYDIGSVTATGQELKNSIGIKEAIEKATNKSNELM